MLCQENDASTVASRYVWDFGPASSHAGDHIIIVLTSPFGALPLHWPGRPPSG